MPTSSPTPNDLSLPHLGEGVDGAKLLRWLVSVGDKVEPDQTLARMETDKAIVEIPTPRAGVIARLHAASRQFVKVGAPLVTFEA